MDLTERIKLIKAKEYDAESLADISKRAFDTHKGTGQSEEWNLPGYDSPEWQLHAIGVQDYYCILLDDFQVGGVLVGSNGKQLKVLERIFVDPDKMRQGIGTQAVKIMMSMYPEVKVWTLGVPAWNTITKKFYEKIGFTQIGLDMSDPRFSNSWYQMVIDYSWSPMKITELEEGMANVTVEGIIKEKSYARMVRSRRRPRQSLSVSDAALVDESGRILLTLWNEQIKTVKVGDAIRVENGYVGSYMGVQQLSAGRTGKIIHIITQ